MRLVMISNRLPFTVSKEKEGVVFQPSVGGLATGIRTYLDGFGDKAPPGNSHLWIGWPGITASASQQSEISALSLQHHSAYPVFIPKTITDKFYYGFCNKTIWPLFHYFPSLTIYDESYWEQYKLVNQMFCDTTLQVLQPDDIVWIHDYQLMLLPELLRRQRPKLSIGFFLHIPFPSFELFRLLPQTWRTEILNGILGADLVGFHTYDYTQYFLRCATRILGYEHTFGHIITDKKIVHVDTFPMGIDFNRFAAAPELPEVVRARNRFVKSLRKTTIILSVDRLDYSKGIANRLRGFEHFLATRKQWRGRIVLVMIVVPSREGVEQYQLMKRHIDELVGEINGKYGTLEWTPVTYQYRSLPFSSLAALYNISDIALVTPLRDGMNLIAKEYLATRTDNTGVLILSEMAGASRELGEAIIINPNSLQEIADAISTALDMPREEQIRRNTVMRERLSQYSVNHWAEEFMTELSAIKQDQRGYEMQLLSSEKQRDLLHTFKYAHRSLLLLDYDGTLVPFADFADLATPSAAVTEIINELSLDSKIDLCIISGRDRHTLQHWFGNLSVGLVAEHGVWKKRPNEEWQFSQHARNDWKLRILPILTMFVNRLPGAHIEEKEFSLVWHYRSSDQGLAELRAAELIDSLMHMTANIDVQILHGNKVIEIRNAGINKGLAAMHWINQDNYDFIMAIGDDWTDEDMFSALPQKAYTIRVGMVRSQARFNLHSHKDVIALLSSMLSASEVKKRKENV